MELDWERLNAIFKPRQDILDGILRCAETPGKVALFNEIASHVHAKLSDNGEPEAKRRKVQAGGSTNGVTNGSSAAGNPADDPILLQVKEISVSVPQRKKFELCFTQNYLYARAPGTAVPIQGMTYAWTDIEFAFYLPVPEKAQVQHNYILFPRGSTIPPKSGPATIEPLVFTVPATAPKEGTVAGSEAGSAAAVSDTYKALFHWALSRRLRAAGSDVTIVASDPNKFHSMVRQPHRPNEKAVHVSGFRGSKDGYLFFLENGILWGFKKPLIFIPLKRIAAVSYTNILQITFNIVVEVFPEEGGEADGADGNEEYEFGMVDQQDYGGIDDYVKRNGLQDRSMADQRKGKLQLAENKAKKGANGEAEAEGDGMTELERAALGEDLDDDDEDEEDYNPGSDDGSDGSGESSEEDDDDDDDAGEDDEEGEGAGDEEEEDGEGEEAKDLSIR